MSSGAERDTQRAYAAGRAVAEFAMHAPKPVAPTDLLDELKKIFAPRQILNNYESDPYVS